MPCLALRLRTCPFGGGRGGAEGQEEEGGRGGPLVPEGAAQTAAGLLSMALAAEP